MANNKTHKKNPGLISDVFVVREDFLAEKPGQVLALLRAWEASVADYKADKGPVWDAVVKKYSLKAPPLDKVALWAYGDYQFRPDWDVFSSMQKARTLGFNEHLDSFTMFSRQFENYRREKIIP